MSNAGVARAHGHAVFWGTGSQLAPAMPLKALAFAARRFWDAAGSLL